MKNKYKIKFDNFFLNKMIGAAILGLLGFGATGIMKGSIAAAIQSYLGSVSSGSLFAALTSAAMTPWEGKNKNKYFFIW